MMPCTPSRATVFLLAFATLSEGISLQKALTSSYVQSEFSITDAQKAQAHPLLGKFNAPNGSSWDEFGRSVSISSDGTTVAVGAAGDDDVGTNAGAVYVFEVSSGNLLQKLKAPDGAPYDWFGFAVSISPDGTTVAVGADCDDDKGHNSGSAYVFEVSSGNLLQKLTAPDGAAYDWFGWSVSISSDGTTVAVGADGNDDKGPSSGSAYVFNVSSGNLLQKLTAPDGAQYDYFGCSVSISSDGTTVAVGASGHDNKAYNSGAMYVFEVSSGNLLHKLTAYDGASEDYFGYAVSITSGTTLAVGADGDDDGGNCTGAVYLFDVPSGNLLRKLTAPDGAPYDYFGYSVSVSSDGTTVAVGADGVENFSGSAYLFEVSSGNLVQKLTAHDGASRDFFGWSVSISSDGTTVAVGARGDDDGGRNSGSLYLFQEQAASTTCDDPASCIVWGDPHIMAFDVYKHRLGRHPSREAFFRTREWKKDQLSFYLEGSYSLVTSEALHIHGLYVKNATDPRFTSLAGITVSGPLLRGNTLSIGTLQELVKWNDESVLYSMPSEFHNEFVHARYTPDAELVASGMTGAGIEVELSSGVSLVVNRWKHSLSAKISMCRGAVGAQGGQCGNFNGDFADDTPDAILGRSYG